MTRVRLSGDPTPEEAVAVVLALDLAARQDAAGTAAGDRPSGWIRAARLEGLGHPSVAAPTELHPQGPPAT